MQEKRVWIRFPCNVEGSCQPILAGPGHQWSAKVQDISQGGVNLLVNRRFEPRTVLQVSLEENDNRLNGFLARVVYSRAESDGLWSLGCVFPSTLAEEEVFSFRETMAQSQ